MIVMIVLLVLVVSADPLFASRRLKNFWKALTSVESINRGPGFDLDQSLALDTVSLGCMECHDGSIGKSIVLKHPDAPYQTLGFRTENHPIGMDYALYASHKPRGYMPSQHLDVRLRLVEGKVSCVTCHASTTGDLPSVMQASYAGNLPAGCTGDSGLTIPLGQLCTACHIDK